MEQELNKLWQRGTQFLNCKYAIMGGAMSWVSEKNLVSAISNAGGFGVIACGAMDASMLDKEIKATSNLTDKNFGVNLITMHPEINELIKTTIKNNVTHVVLAGGIPSALSINSLKDAGIKVICFAPSPMFGRKLIRMGVDALVIEGMEAGGHIGPVSTSVLAQEILPDLQDQIPIFVAGGIGRGEAIASYLEMGAAGCQLGTHFVCTKESIAHTNFKNCFIKASARDAVSSVQLSPEFPVIPVRALKNKATEEFLLIQRETINLYKEGKLSKTDATLKIEKFWAGALRKAVIDGDIENGSLMAGQSVGMVTEERTVQEVIDILVKQAANYLAKNKIMA